MKQMNSSLSPLLLAATVMILTYLFQAKGITYQNQSKADYIDSTASKLISRGLESAVQAAESKEAFLQAYTVFMHPRCRNCHPKGDTPFQGDDSHLHTQGVTRGIDGKGVYANKCSNCHQPQGKELEGTHLPPSHPTWRLPPANRKMVFEGKSPRALAASFKDSSFTGFATMERFIEHVETDLLVRHSFTYGKRPPLSHEDFVARVKEWIQKGAVLPDK